MKRLYQALHEPFRAVKPKTKSSGSSSSNGGTSGSSSGSSSSSNSSSSGGADSSGSRSSSSSSSSSSSGTENAGGNTDIGSTGNIQKFVDYSTTEKINSVVTADRSLIIDSTDSTSLSSRPSLPSTFS